MVDATGFQEPSSGNDDLNAQTFVIKQMLSKLHTATLVKVAGVNAPAGSAPVGFLDVIPLVDQIDGLGKTVPHGTIHGVPYVRIQGGANGVIIDPEVGDVGIAVFASRDISSVKATAGQGPPGSRRRHSMSDALYLGGVINRVPTQYVKFSSTGIEIVSPVKVTIVAPEVGVTSPNIQLQGNVTVTGTMVNNGVNVGSTHVHPGIKSGTDRSGTPQ